ncbi:MAG TPA: HNH endonuclease [Planctomycetaceae bacterium]|nr:HNH endonuclease [Planctomycetaceae bacterium]
MPKPQDYRQFVAARAGGACEYCRLLEAASGVTFHIEHLLPRSQGGRTVMSNLALSCPGCNLAKADRTSGRDRRGREQPLFNPRDFEPAALGWHLHFILDRESGLILPRTPIGEATITTLGMNAPNRVFARKLQIRAGLTG